MSGPLRQAAPAPVDPDLADRLAFVAGSLNRRLRPGAELLTHVGVSALASVQRAGAIRPGALARVEGIAAPATTRVVAELERRGLVSREPDPDDGRSQLIRTTTAGDAALRLARQARATGVETLLAGVGPDDLALLEAAVGVLERALLDAVPVPSR